MKPYRSKRLRLNGAVARAARREAARAGKWIHFRRDDQSSIGARSERLRQIGRDQVSVGEAIRGAVARAARREAARAGKMALRNEARSGLPAKPFAEPWPERPAAKRQERENGSTSFETTGHLSVRALRGPVFAEPWPETTGHPYVGSLTPRTGTLRCLFLRWR